MAILERPTPQVKWCTLPRNPYQNRNNPPQLRTNMWVELLVQLNPFCHTEALLLCQKSETEWVAWVPDHGEAILRVDQFCCPTV